MLVAVLSSNTLEVAESDFSLHLSPGLSKCMHSTNPEGVSLTNTNVASKLRQEYLMICCHVSRQRFK